MTSNEPADAKIIKAVQRLEGLIQDTGNEALDLSARHARKSSRWGAAALWGSWAAAFSATVSTLTIVSEHDAVAAIAAIAAAALSTFVATAKPAERAAEKKTAAAGFEGVFDRLRVMRYDLEEVARSEGQRRTEFRRDLGVHVEAGDWKLVGGDPRKVNAIRKQLDVVRADFEALKTKFPSGTA